MRIRLKFMLLSLLCVFIFSGCASNKIVKTYPGEVLPNNAISILKAPENITLLSVNGKEVAQYLLSNLDVNYGLKEGENLIVFKYESIWSKAKRDEETGSRVEVVESEPLAAVIQAKAGVNYNFNFLPAGNVRDAKVLASGFTAQIVDDSQNLVAESLLLSAYLKSKAEKDAQEQSLLMEQKIVASPDLKPGASVLDRLKSIWPSANADEKKAFLVWVFQK